MYVLKSQKGQFMLKKKTPWRLMLGVILAIYFKTPVIKNDNSFRLPKDTLLIIQLTSVYDLDKHTHTSGSQYC